MGTSLFRYNHANGSWDDLSENVPDLASEAGDYNSQGSYNMFVAVKPDDPNVIFMGGTNLYRSTNGFTSPDSTVWTGGYDARTQSFSLYEDHHPDQHNLVFYPSNPNRVLSSNDGGVSRTEKAMDSLIDWTSLEEGYITSQFYTVALDEQSDDPLIAGGMQDNSTYAAFNPDILAPWTDIAGGDGSACVITYNSIIVSFQFANMFRYGFNDEGENTDNDFINPPNADDPEHYLFINPFIADPVNPNRIFVASRGRVYFTNDVNDFPNDSQWLVIEDPLLDEFEFVTALAATHEAPRNQLYLGTIDGRVLIWPDTQDSEQSLIDVTGDNFPINLGGNPANDAYISCIAVDPTNDNNVFVTFSNYGVLSIFNSQNGGQTWEPISGNLEENPDGTGVGPGISWLSILPDQDRTIYLLATTFGVYATDEINGMNTEWLPVGEENIGYAKIAMIKNRNTDGLVVVGTHGNGAFQAQAEVPLLPLVTTENGFFICEGEQTALRAPIRENLSYTWQRNGQPITNANSFRLIVTQAGEYRVTITDTETGEIFTSELYPVFQVESPNPTITIGNDTLFVSECERCSYQWFSSIGAIPGETENFLVTDLDDPNSYRVRILNPCDTLFSESIVTNLDNYSGAKGISIYPNPIENMLTIMAEDHALLNDLKLVIYDFSGKIVSKHNFNPKENNHFQINLTSLPQGIYMIEIISREGRMVQKIVKQ